MACQRQPRVYVTAEPSDGPIDLLCRDAEGVTVTVDIKRRGETDGVEAHDQGAVASTPRHWAVDVKRRATIDAVEQLTRYLELLNRDCRLAPVGGVLAAQSIAPQARTLAKDRGIRCVVVDYDELRGMPSNHMRLSNLGPGHTLP